MERPNVDGERWAPVRGYDRRYDVSDQGRVYMLPYMMTCRRSDGTTYVRRRDGRVLKPVDNGSGYMRVSLQSGGMQEHAYVHRLVADAFVERPPGLVEVNHKDGDKSNNRADNLEWVTHAENVRHARDELGRFRKPHWYQRALTEEDVRVIRASCETNTDLGRQYGVDPSVISRVRTRSRYREVE